MPCAPSAAVSAGVVHYNAERCTGLSAFNAQLPPADVTMEVGRNSNGFVSPIPVSSEYLNPHRTSSTGERLLPLFAFQLLDMHAEEEASTRQLPICDKLQMNPKPGGVRVCFGTSLKSALYRCISQ